MSNVEISAVFVWSLIGLAWIVPPVLRKLGWTKTEGLFHSSVIGMYLLMIAAGATINMFLTGLN